MASIGDENVMYDTIKLVKDNGVGIGAHPGLPDLKGFGRRNMDITPKEIYNLVVYQLGALDGFCKVHQTRINHVKPHGALYNMGAKIKHCTCNCSSVYDFDSSLILVGLSNTLLITEESLGLRTASEVFSTDDMKTMVNSLVVKRQMQ